VIGTVEQELVELSHEVVRAVQRHDLARLEELLGAEFSLLGAAGELDREEFLAAASGPYEIDDFSYEEIDPQVYGNTGVIVSRYRQHARLDARDLTHELKVTDVWVRRDSRWQLVRRHATVAA
jgi:hypothetical protein